MELFLLLLVHDRPQHMYRHTIGLQHTMHCFQPPSTGPAIWSRHIVCRRSHITAHSQSDIITFKNYPAPTSLGGWFDRVSFAVNPIEYPLIRQSIARGNLLHYLTDHWIMLYLFLNFSPINPIPSPGHTSSAIYPSSLNEYIGHGDTVEVEGVDGGNHSSAKSSKSQTPSAI